MLNSNFNQKEKDQLREVVNIGAGNASTVLSKMVDKKVEIAVPELNIDKVENTVDFFGKSEDVTYSILLKISGEAPGIILLNFSPESALKLAGLLTKNPKKTTGEMDKMDHSALREVANILSGASLSALSDFLGFNLIESIPEEVVDMLGSVVDGVLAEIGQSSEIVLVFKVTFNVSGEEVDTKLYFLFDPSSTSKILEITAEKI